MSTLNAVVTPVATVPGKNTTYTCPDARVAIFRYTLSATVAVTCGVGGTGGTSDLTGGDAQSDSAQTTGELVLKAGDIITSTRTAASATASRGSNGAISASALSTVILALNGVDCHTIVARGSGVAIGSASASSTITVVFAGEVNMSFVAEEYYA